MKSGSKLLVLLSLSITFAGCSVQPPTPHVETTYDKYDQTRLTQVMVHSKSKQGDKINFTLSKGQTKSHNKNYYLCVHSDETGLLIGDRLILTIDGQINDIKLDPHSVGKNTSMYPDNTVKVVAIPKDLLFKIMNAHSIQYEVKVTRISPNLTNDGDADGIIAANDLNKLKQLQNNIA